MSLPNFFIKVKSEILSFSPINFETDANFIVVVAWYLEILQQIIRNQATIEKYSGISTDTVVVYKNRPRHTA